MERMINLQIEELPEGVYLATSDSIQGLVAQGNTITETIEIARDVAKKLIEAQDRQIADLAMFSRSFTYPLVVSSSNKQIYYHSKPYRRYARRNIKSNLKTGRS